MTFLKRLSAVLVMLCLGVLAVAEAILAWSDPGPSRSSKGIDVVVQDEQGYQHFLVFAASPSKIPSWSRYGVEFWVDDWVSVDPHSVSRIVFETDAGALPASFVSTRTRRNQPPHPDTVILEFTADPAVLRTLAARRTESLEWVMDRGEPVRFNVIDPDALRDAAGRALAPTGP